MKVRWAGEDRDPRLCGRIEVVKMGPSSVILWTIDETHVQDLSYQGFRVFFRGYSLTERVILGPNRNVTAHIDSEGLIIPHIRPSR